jgi:WD40 repeat protein
MASLKALTCKTWGSAFSLWNLGASFKQSFEQPCSCLYENAFHPLKALFTISVSPPSGAAPCLPVSCNCVDSMQIWDTRAQDCVALFDVHEDFVADFEYVPASHHLLAASGDGTLSVCNLRKNKVNNHRFLRCFC